MAGTFPISGQIDPKSFPFLLADLHRSGATGSLKVEGPTYQKALYFRNGRILFGSSNDPRDQLGAILIEDGRITPEQLEDVNSKVGPGNPLAKVLAETGFVSQRELSEAARAKVERILSDVVAYTSGSFEFEDGVLPKGAVDLKLSTERLMLSAVRRVGDRGFVLRHLDGLDIVLRPTAELAALRPEVEPETGGLLDHLNGSLTLKDAAGRTRLDDFEAAKVACGLLFLGVVDRRLDLADTARAALESDLFVEPSSPAPAVEETGWEIGGDEPTIRVPERQAAMDDPLTAHSEPFIPAAEMADPLVLGVVEPEPQRSAVPSAAEPPVITEPPAEAEPYVEPWRPPFPAPEGGRADASSTTTQPFAHEMSGQTWPPRAAPPPPSKDDLAALDALLHPGTPEGPMAPLERAREPRMVPTVRSVQARRSSRAASSTVLVATAALVLVGAAVWFFWLRQPAPLAAGTSPAVVASPRAAATALARPPVTAPATPATPAAPAAQPAAVPAAPGGAAAGGSALHEAREQLRTGNLPQAARGFAAHLREAPAGTSSVHLLVACSPDTVHKALANVSAADLFILPVNYKGRDCFRLCWGVYSSQAAAASAARAIPDYFVKGGATPRVSAASELLP